MKKTIVLFLLAVFFVIVRVILFPIAKETVTYLKWNAFGNRLKTAYTAKFGGENTGFNQEVDQHIKIMESMGSGYTKKISEDWLRRMAKFVEVPYVVPEEEYQTEEEKTNNFDR